MQGEVYSESAADGIIGQSAALKAVLTLASRIRGGYMISPDRIEGRGGISACGQNRSKIEKKTSLLRVLLFG